MEMLVMLILTLRRQTSTTCRKEVGKESNNSVSMLPIVDDAPSLYCVYSRCSCTPWSHHPGTTPTAGSSPSHCPVVRHLSPSSNHFSWNSFKLFPLSLTAIAEANCSRRYLMANAVFGSTWYRIFLSICKDRADSYNNRQYCLRDHTGGRR